MSSSNNVDWDNLSFDDLDIIDFENIPSQYVEKVAKMMCLRQFHKSGNLTNRAFSKLTNTHHNTVGRKAKGNGDFSLVDMMVMFAVRDMPQEDIDAIANKGGKLNLSKLWNVFK